MGFTRIMVEKDGASIYGIWILLLGMASRQGKHRSGWLTEDGHPTGTALAPSDFAVLFRRTEPEIVRALDFLCSPRIGWLGTSEVIGEQQAPLAIDPVPGKCPPAAPIPPVSDSEWIKELAATPAYAGINVQVEADKCRVWCVAHKRMPSRKRLLAWLNRVERPMAVQGRAPVSDKPAWKLEAESLIQVMRTNQCQIHDYEPARDAILAGGREAVNWLNSNLTQDERAILLTEWNVNSRWEKQS